MRRKRLGIHWLTIGLTAAIGVFGLFAWEGDKVTWIIWGTVACIVLTAAIYTNAQVVSDPANPNGHSTLLWEGAGYVCIHGVKPSSRTTQCAWPDFHDLKEFPFEPTPEQRAKKIPI